LLDLLIRIDTNVDLWTSALMECSKLFDLISEISNSQEYRMLALDCLLKIKQTLPVIDNKLAAVKVQGSLERYLFEEFDHIDF
jgi:hypothetical protein